MMARAGSARGISRLVRLEPKARAGPSSFSARGEHYITNANLYSMLEIICSFTDTFTLDNNNGQLVERDGQQLQPGNYYIATNGRFGILQLLAAAYKGWVQ